MAETLVYEGFRATFLEIEADSVQPKKYVLIAEPLLNRVIVQAVVLVDAFVESNVYHAPSARAVISVDFQILWSDTVDVVIRYLVRLTAAKWE